MRRACRIRAERTPIPRDDAPLVVTAHLDAAAFAHLDMLRRRHFPAALNKVPAHVSLFHSLPGTHAADVAATIAELCRLQEVFALPPTAIRFLGRGVAIAYEASELSRLHGALAREWRSWLTPQDRQPFKAHVTIQNKVVPAEARALRETLDHADAPICRVEGLSLWRYRGGPWELVSTYLFRAGRG